jgi:hypothetical protein
VVLFLRPHSQVHHLQTEGVTLRSSCDTNERRQSEGQLGRHPRRYLRRGSSRRDVAMRSRQGGWFARDLSGPLARGSGSIRDLSGSLRKRHPMHMSAALPWTSWQRQPGIECSRPRQTRVSPFMQRVAAWKCRAAAPGIGVSSSIGNHWPNQECRSRPRRGEQPSGCLRSRAHSCFMRFPKDFGRAEEPYPNDFRFRELSTRESPTVNRRP